MLQISLAALNAIALGVKPVWKVKVHFQEPEVYTEADYLQSVTNISGSMSREGGYAINNATVTLKNIEYYFSEKFEKELPDLKLAEIFFSIIPDRSLVIEDGELSIEDNEMLALSQEETLAFRGICPSGGWTLDADRGILTLNLNA